MRKSSPLCHGAFWTIEQQHASLPSPSHLTPDLCPLKRHFPPVQPMCSRSTSSFLRNLLLLMCINSFSLLHFLSFLSPPSFLIFSFVRSSHLKITRLNVCISFSATFLSLYPTLQPSLKAVPASSVLSPCLIHSNPVSFPIAMTHLYLLSVLMSNRFPSDEYFSAPFMSDVSKGI